MEKTLLQLRICKNHVSLFAGYIYEKILYTLNYIEKDINFSFEKYDDENLIALIKEVISNNEETLNTTFSSLAVIIDDYSFDYKNRSFKNDEKLSEKNMNKYCKDILNAYPEIDNYTKSFINFDEKSKSLIDYELIYIDDKKVDEILNLAAKLDLELISIAPTLSTYPDLLKYFIKNLSKFNILSFEKDNITYVKYDGVSIIDYQNLNVSMNDLVKKISEETRTDIKVVEFIINHYGYNENYAFDANLCENIKISTLNKYIENFIKDSLGKLNNISFVNQTFIFGELSNLIGLEVLLKKLNYDNFIAPRFLIIGARNIICYPHLGMLLHTYKSENFDFSSFYFKEDDYEQ